MILEEIMAIQKGIKIARQNKYVNKSKEEKGKIGKGNKEVQTSNYKVK